MYRKITQKLSEAGKKISGKLSTNSSRNVCTAAADATTGAPLRPIWQRRRKITEASLVSVKTKAHGGVVRFPNCHEWVGEPD